MSDKPMKFTGKQQAFIDAYFACNFNGVRAARAAGYKGSYSVLGVAAHDNLKNPKIRAEIDRRFKELVMGKDEVLTRLTEIARADFGDLTDKDGNFDLKLAKRRGKSFLIKEQEFTEKFIPQEGHDDIVIRTAKVKLHDPMRALELIGKYHSLFTEKQDITSGGEKIALNVVYKGKPDAT
jgi:phage terminase small subunit